MNIKNISASFEEVIVEVSKLLNGYCRAILNSI